MRVLMSRGGDVEAGDAVDASDIDRLYAAPSEPWLRVNMVSTLDGAATGDSGKAGSINNAADKVVYDALRAAADVIVVGAGTARIEGYGPVDKPIVAVTRSGRVPPTLVGGPPGSVLVATCSASPNIDEVKSLVGEEHVLVVGEHNVDLVGLRRELVDRGFARQLSEGGPRLLRDMLECGIVDELCVTVVPRIVGGAHVRIVAGAGVDADLDLRLLLEEDGTLLGRWFTGRQDV
jgi:riboflavin biosynthesis pyrimidine reductase